ncbi:MAG: hypothetical protein WBR15_06235 [Gammaproteobacteria bacterium]
MDRDAEALTSLKELDKAWIVPKGTAFRTFKQALPALVENRDFIRLDAMRHHTEIENLRAAGRIYAGSANVVLLFKTGVNKLARP